MRSVRELHMSEAIGGNEGNNLFPVSETLGRGLLEWRIFSISQGKLFACSC